MKELDYVFLKRLAEIIDVKFDEIEIEMSLTDENWDSLNIVSTAALIDEIYDVQVNGDKLIRCNNVEQIIELINEYLNA